MIWDQENSSPWAINDNNNKKKNKHICIAPWGFRGIEARQCASEQQREKAWEKKKKTYCSALLAWSYV